MDGVAVILLIALMSERLVEVFKTFVSPLVSGWADPQREALWRLFGVAAGLVLAFGLRADLFAATGVEGTSPVLGMILAGIFAGTGTEWVHNLLTDLPRLAVEGRQVRLMALKSLNGANHRATGEKD